jgi:hypothetical protein
MPKKDPTPSFRCLWCTGLFKKGTSPTAVSWANVGHDKFIPHFCPQYHIQNRPKGYDYSYPSKKVERLTEGQIEEVVAGLTAKPAVKYKSYRQVLRDTKPEEKKEDKDKDKGKNDRK